MSPYACTVNPTTLALLALLAAATIAALLVAFTRRRRSLEERSQSDQRPSKMRFETTMGELRDIREALRPAEGVAADRPRSSSRPV